MNFKIKKLGETEAYSINNFRYVDERGQFSHVFREEDEIIKELNDFKSIKNIYCSSNPIKGTFRGFHKQNSPNAEAKIMRCITGSVMHYIAKLKDGKIIVDKNLLTEYNCISTFVPRECYSAFMTLEADTTILYLTDANYNKNCATGIRWNDPKMLDCDLNINPIQISESDNNMRNLP